MTTTRRRVAARLHEAAADAHRVADVEETKARLRAEFPGWSIIHTNRERWWATRGPLPRGDAGIADLEDDTADGLRAKLQALTDRER